MKINKKDSVGKLGEDLTLIFLKRKGYKIIERNWLLHRVGEIDLILEKSNEIIFVEVKTSENSFEDALRNYSDSKRRKFIRVVSKYVQRKNIKQYKLKLFLVKVDLYNKKSKIREIFLF